MVVILRLFCENKKFSSPSSICQRLVKLHLEISLSRSNELKYEMLSHGAECNMFNIFRVSHILQLFSRDNNKTWETTKIFTNIAQGNVR